jgi:hypothetical protein
MMFSLTALLCPLLVLAMIAAIIVVLVRSLGRNVSRAAGGAGGTQSPLNVVTQLAQDGFWLSSFEPGSVVYYNYWAGGAKHPGQAVFQPGQDGRQFVYTGIRPESVEILRVAGPGGGISPGQAVYVEDDSPGIGGAIIGAVAADAVMDALGSAQSEPPAPPPSPPQFPAAY